MPHTARTISADTYPWPTAIRTTLSPKWITVTTSRTACAEPDGSTTCTLGIARDLAGVTGPSATANSKSTSPPSPSPTGLTPAQLGGIFAGIAVAVIILLAILIYSCAARRYPPSPWTNPTTSPPSTPPPPPSPPPQPRPPDSRPQAGRRTNGRRRPDVLEPRVIEARPPPDPPTAQEPAQGLGPQGGHTDELGRPESPEAEVVIEFRPRDPANVGIQYIRDPKTGKNQYVQTRTRVRPQRPQAADVAGGQVTQMGIRRSKTQTGTVREWYVR